jgi:hypothetical protein
LIFVLLSVLILISDFWGVVKSIRANRVAVPGPRREEYTSQKPQRDNDCIARIVGDGRVYPIGISLRKIIRQRRSKVGQVVINHPKLVRKWALRYINLYRLKGPDVAKNWALEFLPPEPRQAMVEKVNEIQKKNKRPPDGVA